MNATSDDASADTAELCATYLKALGDSIRLKIVRELQGSPLTVTDLTELLEMDIAKVSHHLRVLYHANLVTIQKDGKYSYYQLNQEFLKRTSLTKSLDFGCCKIDLRR